MNAQDSDLAFLLAALQNTLGPVEVDGQKLAQQLGLSLSSIPPKFSHIRRRYNLKIKVMNTGAIRRNRQSAPDPEKVQPTECHLQAGQDDQLQDRASA